MKDNVDELVLIRIMCWLSSIDNQISIWVLVDTKTHLVECYNQLFGLIA
jgi:hypothetical protein